ncbi:hypothetical protein GC173_09005 [bacterium]|nr:hypothetical protein [bacterium]
MNMVLKSSVLDDGEGIPADQTGLPEGQTGFPEGKASGTADVCQPARSRFRNECHGRPIPTDGDALHHHFRLMARLPRLNLPVDIEVEEVPGEENGFASRKRSCSPRRNIEWGGPGVRTSGGHR